MHATPALMNPPCEAEKDFIAVLRERHPGRPIFRLEFESPQTMRSALPWLMWVRKAQDSEPRVRPGVLARGFAVGDKAVLIVGGKLTEEEVAQLHRIAERFAGEAHRVWPPSPETGQVAGTRTAAPDSIPWRWIAAAGLVIVALAGAWWATRPDFVSAAAILANPERSDGRTVRLRGTVVGPATVQGARAYLLADDTGRIAVATARERLPEASAEAVVTGTVVASPETGAGGAVMVREQSASIGSAARLERTDLGPTSMP